MNKENLENLKWALRFLVLAAIISYGLGLTLNRNIGQFELLSTQQVKDVKEVMAVFPEGIRAVIKYGHKKEYWEDILYVTKIREKSNPTFVGGLIVSIFGESIDETSSRSMEWTSGRE